MVFFIVNDDERGTGVTCNIDRDRGEVGGGDVEWKRTGESLAHENGRRSVSNLDVGESDADEFALTPS